MSDITEQLGRLADLRDRGVLTQDEFDQQKAVLLQNPTDAPSLASAATPDASASAVVSPTVAAPTPPSAPAPAPLRSPAVDGNEREQLLRAFIGPNADYYLHQWGETGSTIKKTGWNVPAFFLSIFWFFYRKMKDFGLIAAGAFLVLVLISSLVRSPAVDRLINLVEIGMAVWIGFNANRLYRGRAEAALSQVQVSTPDPAERLAAMRARGGVSLPLALGSAAAWVVAVLLITYVLLKIGSAGVATGVPGYAVAPNDSTGTSTATGGAAVAAAPTSAPVAPDDTWLMGQWENVATPACAQWLRFGADHSLGDNANSSGTWSLGHSADGSWILSMNITGTGLREGPIEHDVGAGTITMGSAPNTVTWRKTTC